MVPKPGGPDHRLQIVRLKFKSRNSQGSRRVVLVFFDFVAIAPVALGSFSESLTVTSAAWSRVTVRSSMSRDLRCAFSTSRRRTASRPTAKAPIAKAPTATAPMAVAIVAKAGKLRDVELRWSFIVPPFLDAEIGRAKLKPPNLIFGQAAILKQEGSEEEAYQRVVETIGQRG